jgi:hypothetical protein
MIASKESALARISKSTDLYPKQLASEFSTPVDLEIGDTEDSEVCATMLRPARQVNRCPSIV